MKKQKSVVAILLAVMMIFTMMPMMAFADTNPPASKIVSWGPLYATATGDNNIEFATARVQDLSSGLIAATPQNKVEDVVGGETWVAPEATATYYDLAGSKFAYAAGSEFKALDGTTWTRDEFSKVVAGTTAVKVMLVEQTYTEGYKESSKTAGYKAQEIPVDLTISQKAANTYTGTAVFGDNGEWTLTLKDFTFDATATENQTVAFEVKSILPAADITTDGVNAVDLVNASVASATVTVNGKAKTPAEANFYLDKVGGPALDEGVYDGKAHTVVVDETPGYTWSYQVRNAQGKFEDVSAVTVTDVTDPITFKAFYTDSKGVKTQFGGNMTLQLNPLTSAERFVTIGWDQKASAADEGYIYLVDGTEYNADSYITYAPYEEKAASGETAAQAAARIAKNEAAKSAASVNAAQLKEYFAAYYEIKDVTSKSAAAQNQVELQIAEKTLSAADKAAADEKFAQLNKNFGTYGIEVADDYATIQLNADKIDYEIEFTKAPEGAKVVHIKKAKKLKKNTAFSVKAVSNMGVAVSYKLINANSKITINKTTGKITLKKGLKKGTYKFKVKAYVPGYSVDAYEIQNIVVKIKK